MSRIDATRSRVTRRRRPRALTRSALADAESSELLANTRVDCRLNERLLRRRDVLASDEDGDGIADRGEPTFASRGAVRQTRHNGAAPPIRHRALQVGVVLRVASIDVGRNGALLRVEGVLCLSRANHAQPVEDLRLVFGTPWQTEGVGQGVVHALRAR